MDFYNNFLVSGSMISIILAINDCLSFLSCRMNESTSRVGGPPA